LFEVTVLRLNGCHDVFEASRIFSENSPPEASASSPLAERRSNMPSKILQEVADYCWSKNFLGMAMINQERWCLVVNNLVICQLHTDVFRNFFAEHGEAFVDAPPLTGGEHNMKYYSLFQVYLKLYEVTNSG
jgi:hypothetical protein